MQPSAFISGNDCPIGESTTQNGRIACECSHWETSFEVPHLQRFVQGGGNRPLPVLSQRSKWALLIQRGIFANRSSESAAPFTGYAQTPCWRV